MNMMMSSVALSKSSSSHSKSHRVLQKQQTSKFNTNYFGNRSTIVHSTDSNLLLMLATVASTTMPTARTTAVTTKAIRTRLPVQLVVNKMFFPRIQHQTTKTSFWFQQENSRTLSYCATARLIALQQDLSMNNITIIPSRQLQSFEKKCNSIHHFETNSTSDGIRLQRQRLFSSVATSANDDESEQSNNKSTTTTTKKSKRENIVSKKDPIIVTDRAANRIAELLNGENAASVNAIGMRVGVKRRGCNGLSYTLNYATNDKASKDIHVAVQYKPVDSTEKSVVNVYIEPMALFNVVGTVMDYEENDMGSEFTFNNPNSKGSCGCGESFNV